MVRTLQALIVAMLFMTPIALIAKPMKPPVAPQKDAPKAAPKAKLEGATNWGDFLPLGDKQFTLDNHPVWSGIGTVREDGSVFLLWTFTATEEACPGVYAVQPDGSLAGVWGYGHDTKLEADGTLTGNIRPDRVHNLPPPDPPGL